MRFRIRKSLDKFSLKTIATAPRQRLVSSDDLKTRTNLLNKLFQSFLYSFHDVTSC